MDDVALGPGEEIVDAHDFMAFADQSLAKMRSKEARASRDKDAFPALI